MARSRVLRDRVAGQSAMCLVVSSQRDVRPQSLVARIFGISPLTLQAQRSYRGALGELLVGDVLENLGQRWDVLHDIPLGGDSLDHLVIGPAGVFTVHTAHCRGVEVTVDGDAIVAAGQTRDDIPVARASAASASQFLSAAAGRTVEVQSILAVVDPRRLILKSTPDSVNVIASAALEKLLCGAPAALEGDEVALISDVADLESTWPAADSTNTDIQSLYRDFSVIRSRVRTALVRRIAWATASTAAVYLGVCSVIATLVSTMMA